MFELSISFTLRPKEKFTCTTTSRDFGFSKKLGSMPKLCNSSSSLLMFWSLNNHGRFAGLFIVSWRSVDSSPCLLYPAFRLCSVANPGDFASLLNRKISSGSWFSLLYSWPLSYDFIKFSCGMLMFLRMNFNGSAAFLIFNAHCEQTWDDKEDSELKQSLRSFINYFTEGDISCARLLRIIQIFARKVIIVSFKV